MSPIHHNDQICNCATTFWGVSNEQLWGHENSVWGFLPWIVKEESKWPPNQSGATSDIYCMTKWIFWGNPDVQWVGTGDGEGSYLWIIGGSGHDQEIQESNHGNPESLCSRLFACIECLGKVQFSQDYSLGLHWINSVFNFCHVNDRGTNLNSVALQTPQLWFPITPMHTCMGYM